MSSSTRIAVSILLVAILGGVFWLLLISPQRQKASELGDEVAQLQTSLAESQAQADQAALARKSFPGNYQQLVVLGKAVPAGDETSSLLVQLNQIAKRSHVQFNSIKLGASSEESGGETAAAPTATLPSAKPVPPTEAAAALLPLGATVGAAGLGVMPYNLTFSGDFFHVADFIEGIDSLVKAKNSHVAVDGRLITLSGFTLAPDTEEGFSQLQATFSVTTYLTPPSQGIAAGASPAGPETAALAATESPETTSGTATASTTTPAVK